MIFLDANVFLRFLVQATTPEHRAMAQAARSLFEAARRGELEITTTEIALYEVVYVRASKKHFGLPPEEIAKALNILLNISIFRLPRGEKKIYLKALGLYVRHPQLGFADAVVAARVMERGLPLATFDEDFDGLPGVRRWQPAGLGPS
ncbi:MAG: hypothetical protein C4346_12920 [Chloroflexota bacterium]